MPALRIKAYRNLNNGKISLQCVSNGLILGHCDAVFMNDVRFVVRERGRLRVIESRQKNVHAFVIGDIEWAEGFEGFRGRSILALAHEGRLDLTGYEAVTYNPYRMATFSSLKGMPIHQARSCFVSTDRGVHIIA